MCCTSREAGLRSVEVCARVVRHPRRGPLVLRRAASHRGVHVGGCRGAHCRLRRSCVRCRAHALQSGIEAVFQGSAFEPLAWLVGRARSAPPCVVRSPGAAPAFGSCLARASINRASCRRALVAQVVRLKALCLAQVWRGKLAVMARKEVCSTSRLTASSSGQSTAGFAQALRAS